ncbi:phage tail tip lysozyme [Methylosinus sp. PW1]|uniref:phage tail tip lysozyme n=1 Tax=Methylosinus sp. PW1 TaxID=107636 RepID=UPI000562ED6D|nr:phage tail tip lysozyme [Methylosinus sp. PW1]
MADLPIPNVPLVTAEMPSSRVSGSVFQEPQRIGIGSGLEAIAGGVDQMAQSLAESEGRQDAMMGLQRGADGKLNVATPENNVILGNAGRAYQHAFNVGTLAGLQTNINEQANDLRNKFPGDPEGFKVAMGKYADTIRANYPGALGAAAFNHATELGSQYYIGAVNDKKNTDVSAAYQEITTRLTDLKTDTGNIARGTVANDTKFLDDPSTPAGKNFAQVKAYYQSLADNPEFKKTWTQAKVDSEIRQARQQFVNDWALGNAQSIRDKDGVDAAVKWSEKNVLNSDTNMPYGERLGAHNMVLAKIQTLTEEQKAKAQASSAAVDGFTKLYQNGTPPTEEQFQAVQQSARESFDVAGVARLQAFHDAYSSSIKPYAGVAPRAAVGTIMGPAGAQATASAATSGRAATAMQFFQSRGWTKEQSSGIVGNLVGESGRSLDANAVGDGGISIGIGQWNNERAAALKAYAAAKGKPWNDFQTQLEFVDRELHGSEISAGTALQGAKTADEAARAILGYERPRGWAPGAPAEGVSGWSNRRAAALALAGDQSLPGATTVAGQNSPVPFTPDQLRQNPYLASAAVAMFTQNQSRQIEFAKNQAGLIEQAIKMGAPVDQTSVAQVLQIAQANPRELGDVATKLRAQADAAPVAMMAAGQPDGGAGFIAQAEEEARRSPDLYHLARADAIRSQVEGRAKALADNPHAYASRSDVGWTKPVAPIEAVAQPGAVGAQTPADAMGTLISQRREAAFQIGSRLGVDPSSLMFSKPDIDGLTHMLQRVDGSGADTILRSLQANLRPPELEALAQNKDFTNAVAGLTRSGDPGKAEAAYGFLDKQWRQNPEAFKKEYGADIETKMAVFQDKIAFMTPDAAAKAMAVADDPATARAKEGRREEADKALKDLSSDHIAKQLFGSWVPFMSPGSPVSNDANMSSSALLADYRSAYRDLFAESGDKSLSEKRALERVSQKWGASDLNGGRVMAYPPERYYAPDINGSRKYVTDQLNADVDAAAKRNGIELAHAQEYVQSPHALVADQTTQEDVASRKPPSYRVVTQDKDGQWHALEDRPGVPLRFWADRDGVVRAQEDRFLLQRRQSAENMRMGAW